MLCKGLKSKNSKALYWKVIIDESDLLKNTFVIQWNIKRKNDLRLLVTKLTEKILDISNAKEHYQLFLKNKNKKSVKRWKIIIE